MAEDAGLVDGFVRARADLLRVADTVPPALRETPFVGHWHLIDLLAHLVGWDYTNVNAIKEFKAGRIPEFYRHYNPGWAAYNQQLIDRYGSEDWDALRESLRQSQEVFVAMLHSLTPEQLAMALSEPGRRRPVSIAAILRAALRDEREHLEQIRAFVASQGIGSG